MVSLETYSKHLNNLRLSIDNDIFLSGLSMLILNIGTKYIYLDISPKQDELIKNVYFRRFVIFIIFWVGTKDFKYSLMFTMVYIIFIVHLLNENSPYFIFKTKNQV